MAAVTYAFNFEEENFVWKNNSGHFGFGIEKAWNVF